MSTPATAQPLLRKSHRSALVVPVPLSPQIRDLRQHLEHKGHRWMPHMNLAYPFHPYDCATQATTAHMIRNLCLQIPSFTVKLEHLNRFEQKSGRHLVYAAPKNGGPFLNLQELLADTFPDCADVSHYTQGYKPHLVLGALPQNRVKDFDFDAIQENWHPIIFRVNTIAWAMRSENSAFAIGETFNLLTTH